jgi:DNA-binding FadR family transcriptional regulator
MLAMLAKGRKLKPQYVADGVFDTLAAEILHGMHEVGAAFPAERVLSERFGVSKLLVRQAIHRLAKAGLVAVRQGDATRVLDPTAAYALPVIELYYRMAGEPGATIGVHVLEKQYTQGLAILDVFARRASGPARSALFDVCRTWIADREEVERRRAFLRFQESFWRLAAREGGNRILAAEVTWWYESLERHPVSPDAPPIAAQFAFYCELARRLRDHEDAVGYYAMTLGPRITALFGASYEPTRVAGRRPDPDIPREARARRRGPNKRGRVSCE